MDMGPGLLCPGLFFPKEVQMDTEQYLKDIFGEELDEQQYILIWTTPPNRSYWCKSPEQAEEVVASLPQEKHIYYGIGLSPQDFGRYKRCRSDKICALAGLQADLDVRSHLRNDKKPYFESKEQAIHFAKNCLLPNLPPTFIIDSGHGIYANWIFKEPLVLDTQETKNYAQKLLKDFVLTLKNRATKLGYDVDSTPDLPRVFRLPGTWNYKDENDPKKCFVMEDESSREYYAETDFDGILDEAPQQEDVSNTVTKWEQSNYYGLKVDETREPPYSTIETLCSTDKKFKQTWEFNRHDLSDRSFSTHDMALANICVAYNLSAQQIADLIIAFRKKHGSVEDQKKALRVDYINTTIMKAKQAIGENEANEELDQAYTQLQQHKEDPFNTPKPDRSNTLNKLKEALKLDIYNVKKYDGDTPTFEMILEDGTIIPLGGIKNLIDQSALRCRIAERIHKNLKKIKSDVWEKYRELLLEVIVTIDLGPDSTSDGQLYDMLLIYLRDKGFAEKPEYAHVHSKPFKKHCKRYGEERTYIFLDDFIWHMQTKGEKMFKSQVLKDLHKLGGFDETGKFYEENSEGERKRVSKRVKDVTIITEKRSARVMQIENHINFNNNNNNNNEQGDQDGEYQCTNK